MWPPGLRVIGARTLRQEPVRPIPQFRIRLSGAQGQGTGSDRIQREDKSTTSSTKFKRVKLGCQVDLTASLINSAAGQRWQTRPGVNGSRRRPIQSGCAAWADRRLISAPGPTNNVLDSLSVSFTVYCYGGFALRFAGTLSRKRPRGAASCLTNASLIPLRGLCHGA
jgi:hypothetical protein